MKKKRIKKLKRKKTLKSIKKVVKRTMKSKSHTPLFIFCLLLISTISIFVQRPTIQFHNRTPRMQKQLVIRIPTPTPAMATTTSSPLIKKAQAKAIENNDYCINIPILFYHHVEPASEAQIAGHAQFTVDNSVFETQMSYLKENGYITVTMDTLVDGIMNKKQFAPKTIGLTFDDGYADAYSYVYQTLKKYGFIGNFAISTGLVDTPGYLSWEQLTEIARDPSMKIYNHTSMHIDLVSNQHLAEDEIASAQNTIQNRLGLRSHIFFYPYGSFDHATVATLRARGYIAAFSTLPGTLQCESSLMQLSRTRIGNAPLSLYGL